MEKENSNNNGNMSVLALLKSSIEKLWEKADKSWDGIKEQLESMKETAMGKMGGGRVIDWAEDVIDKMKEEGEKFPESAEELFQKIKEQFEKWS